MWECVKRMDRKVFRGYICKRSFDADSTVAPAADTVAAKAE